MGLGYDDMQRQKAEMEDTRAILVGGPCDGETYEVQPGQSVLYVDDPGELNFDFSAADPLDEPAVKSGQKHIYHRAPPLKNNRGDMFFHIFVWEGGPTNESKRADRKFRFQDIGYAVPIRDKTFRITGFTS
jgi:hypothetical protein